MLDNVVEHNSLPLPEQVEEILLKRRHGLGFLGLGSAMVMLRIKYGSSESVQLTDRITYTMAYTSYMAGCDLAEEKGMAPLLKENTTITDVMLSRFEHLREYFKPGDIVSNKEMMSKSLYIQQFPKNLQERISSVGCRYTHAISIAPCGTISLSFGNNASNGIEPSFSFEYSRNIIKEGSSTKRKVPVTAFELLEYRRLIDPNANVNDLPSYFVSADEISPDGHLNVQASAQKWVDSAISKTLNVQTDFPYDDFKDIYIKGYEANLAGVTTFRFNPERFQGVLVKDEDLNNTVYKFISEDNTTVEARGSDIITYDGEEHTAANLYDALKEGYYGKL